MAGGWAPPEVSRGGGGWAPPEVGKAPPTAPESDDTFLGLSKGGLKASGEALGKVGLSTVNELAVFGDMFINSVNSLVPVAAAGATQYIKGLFTGADASKTSKLARQAVTMAAEQYSPNVLKRLVGAISEYVPQEVRPGASQQESFIQKAMDLTDIDAKNLELATNGVIKKEDVQNIRDILLTTLGAKGGMEGAKRVAEPKPPEPTRPAAAEPPKAGPEEDVLSKWKAKATEAEAERRAADPLADAPTLKKAGFVDQYGKPLALAATGAGLAALWPGDDKDKSLAAMIGIGMSLERLRAAPDSIPLGAILEPGTNTLKTLERFPKGRFDFSTKEVREALQREGVPKAEKDVILPVLEGRERISAKDLVSGIKMATGDFELRPKETSEFADYGLENIDRGYNPPLPATTTIYQSPVELGTANHFSDPNYFAHTRSFEEGGVRHVVEMQSDVAQKAGKAPTAAERSRLEARREELRELELQHADELIRLEASQGARLTDPHTGRPLGSAYSREDLQRVRALRQEASRISAEIAEIGSKLQLPKDLERIQPMLKDWHKRLVREELARAGRGEGSQQARAVAEVSLERSRYNLQAFQERYPNRMWPERERELEQAVKEDKEYLDSVTTPRPASSVRFATADTVAKVEGWPETPRGETYIDNMQRRVRQAELNVDDYRKNYPGSIGLRAAERELQDLRDELARVEEATRTNAPRFRPEHQGIYDRYRGDVEPFLRKLGGKPYTDQHGHTWIEVPTEGARGKGGEQTHAMGRAQMFGRSTPEFLKWLGIASTGAAVGAYAADREKLEAALAGAAVALLLPRAGKVVSNLKLDARRTMSETGKVVTLAGIGYWAGSDKKKENSFPLTGALIGAAIGISPHLLKPAVIAKIGEMTIDERGQAYAGAFRERMLDVNAVKNALVKGIPDAAKRSAAAHAIERGDLSAFSPTERRFIDLYRNFNEVTRVAAEKAGVLKDALTNYVTHVIERDPRQVGVGERVVDTLLRGPGRGGAPISSPFAKARNIPTLAELHAALEGSGLRIKTTDIAEIAEIYGRSMWKAIETKRFLDDLRANKDPRTGKPWVAETDDAPFNYVSVRGSAAMQGLRVHPEIQAPMEFWFSGDNPGTIRRAFAGVSQGIKRSIFLGTLFHAKSLAEAFVLGTGAWGLKEVLKEAARPLGGEKLWGKTAVQKAVDDYNRAGPKSAEAVREGLELGYIDDINPHALSEFGEMVAGRLGGKVLGAVERVQNRFFDRIIWGYIHTGGKLAVWDKLKQTEIERRDAAIQAGKMRPEEAPTDEQIGRQVSNAVNAFGGGLDWHKVATEARTQLGRELAHGAFGVPGRAVLGMLALAPDWNISTFRVGWKSLPGATSEPITRALARKYMARTVFGMWVAMDALQYQMTGWHLWDDRQKDPTKLQWKNGLQVQMGKHAFEVFEFARHPADVALAKGAPIWKAPVESLMDRQWLSTGWSPKLDSRVGHLLGAPVPIALKGGGGPERSPELAAEIALANFLGFPVTGSMDTEVAARKEAKKNDPEAEKKKLARILEPKL